MNAAKSRRKYKRLVLSVLVFLIFSFAFMQYYLRSGSLSVEAARQMLLDFQNRSIDETTICKRLGSNVAVSAVPKMPGKDCSYTRQWTFCEGSLNQCHCLEATGVFDQQGIPQFWIMNEQTLEGSKLWQFRWRHLLKRLGM